MPRSRYRLLSIALVAASATFGIADAGVAKTPKPPKAPSATVIKSVLGKAYCPPDKNARSEDVDSVGFTLGSLKRSTPRFGRYFYDGVPPNKKTWVFPVRAAYSCLFTIKPGYTGRAKRIDFQGDYVFFKDEFGTWTHKNSKHDYTISYPGS